MVMERPLSPQSVGREFVRQYYTLLNEAPAHLHRFYNNSSSFIHGGLDAPHRESVAVVGQKQIHQRIQQLNFRDCHAKISQVDSQATLGNGVVVQVTGELSNAGQAMRRFTQTFVLAAQSPKKYYVHNDIFRYQDKIITDEDMEGDMSRSEAGEDQESEVQHNDMEQYNVQAGAQQQAGGYYGNQVVNGTSEAKPAQEECPGAGPLCDQPAGQPQAQPQPAGYEDDWDQPQPSQPPMSAPVEEMMAAQQQPAPYLVVELQNSSSSQPPDHTDYHLASSPVQPPLPPQMASVQPHIMSNEPKTYATLVKSGSQVGGPVYYNTSPTNQNQAQHQSSEDMSPPPQMKSENKGFDMRSNHNTPKPQRNEPIRNNYNSTPRQQPIDEHNGNSVGGDGDRRRLQYSDSHQVFVGNIPRNVTESALRDVFAQFGTIVGLKIFPKNTSKGAGQLKVPFYGFVTFEEVSSVQAVLNTTKPIMFPDENGVKLNVEEKKARRGEGGGGGGGGRGGGRGGGPMMRGGLGSGTPPRGGRGGGGVRFNTPMATRR